jgi:hypothetical protein
VAVAAVAAVAAIVVAALLLTRSTNGEPQVLGDETATPVPSSPAASTPTSSPSPSSAASTPKASRTPKESVPPPTATGEPTVVPSAATSTTKAPIDKKGDLGNGVEVRVNRIENVQGEAQGPGEVAGPALRVSITVKNNTSKAVSMELALANLYYGKEATPASPLSGPGADPLTRAIPAGKSATGRYVFGVPKDERDQIQVEFSYTTKAPTVIFTGAA